MTIKEQCIHLREEGKTYNEICIILHCSKSTVAYHLNTTTKIAATKWQSENKCKDWKYKFMHSCSNFLNRRDRSKHIRTMCSDWNKKFRTHVSEFNNRYKNKGNLANKCYYKDVLTYLNGTNVKCYLTGTPIDLTKDDYCFDHIVPVSKGGTNELSNLGVTIPSANYSKHDLTIEEYLSLCKQVLEHHGYTVSKT